MVDASTGQDRINILDLRDSPWVDGPGRTILDCARSLEGDRFHFVIATFDSGDGSTNEYAAEACRRGLHVELIPEKSSFDRTVPGHINRIIDENDIHLIHTHDFRTNIFGLICARKRKLPIISTVHGWIANNMKGKIYGLIDRFLLRFFDHIISVSERTQKILRKAMIRDSKTSVIENALILEQYVINRGNKNLRSEFSSGKEDATLIANIGRLSPEKGQLEFLKAGCEVHGSHPDIVLILIGIGPDEAMLREFVRKNGMDDYVVFCGFRKDMIDIYNNLDLVVQSSFTEGMPNVVLETLLMELPVIATDVGGTAEIITSDETGMLIKPGVTEELVFRISEFLDKPEKYKKMATAGHHLIRERFDHNRRVDKLRSLYERFALSQEST